MEVVFEGAKNATFDVVIFLPGVKYSFLPHFRLLNRKTSYDVFNTPINTT
jgi:hypothetical protein